MVSIPSTKPKEQETGRKDFTIIRNEILRDPNLSAGCKLTLIMLISYCWFDKNHCFPGQERLATDLQKSVRTIRRYLTELQEKTYIKIHRKGLGRPNHYTITLPYGIQATTQEEPKATYPDRTKVTAESNETKQIQVESDEAFSNSLKGFDELTPTDCHIAQATIGNTKGERRESPPLPNRDTASRIDPLPRPPSETSKSEPQEARENSRQLKSIKRIDEIMGKNSLSRPKRTSELPILKAPPLTQADMDKRKQEKIASERQQSPLEDIIPSEHLQTLNLQFGTGTQKTNFKIRQLVYEKLQIVIERISEELGDFKHVTSNITQAENIRREANADIEQFIVTLYDARAATKQAITTGRITKKDSTGEIIKMPYFYAVLRQKTGVSKTRI